jgi:hypothetical protein
LARKTANPKTVEDRVEAQRAMPTFTVAEDAAVFAKEFANASTDAVVGQRPSVLEGRRGARSVRSTDRRMK